jgi:hypothetical protein
MAGTSFFVDYQKPAASNQPYNLTVGRAPAGNLSNVGKTDTLWMSPSDTTITLRVYVDHTFSEAYWQGGRVAMTTTTAASAEASQHVFSAKPVQLQSAVSHAVNSIWVGTDEVLRQHAAAQSE